MTTTTQTPLLIVGRVEKTELVIYAQPQVAIDPQQNEIILFGDSAYVVDENVNSGVRYFPYWETHTKTPECVN